MKTRATKGIVNRAMSAARYDTLLEFVGSSGKKEMSKLPSRRRLKVKKNGTSRRLLQRRNEKSS